MTCSGFNEFNRYHSLLGFLLLWAYSKEPAPAFFFFLPSFPQLQVSIECIILFRRSLLILFSSLLS
jgi:hypothetical protein